jgi:hypothetical protein
MIIRNTVHLSSMTLLLVGAAALQAQVTTGSMSGRVTGQDGKPIPGVRVAFDSPALFQPRVLVTDAAGQYRAQLLPVGYYTIRVSAQGWIGKTAENIRVGLGTNSQFDFTLRVIQNQAATIEVVANVVSEAKTDDKVATNFSAEDLIKLPSDRSWDGAAQLSPGVTGGGDYALNIRGGSSAGQGHLGGGYAQVNYTVDGIDVKDDTGSGRTTLYDPLPDSIEDIQLIQSQLNARYGRTSGGAVNIATKSGSNTFEGTIREFINRSAWTTNISKGPVGGDISQSELNAVEGYSRNTDITFSGPLIKDRLWFFLATRLQPNVSSTTRLGWGRPGVMQETSDGGSTWTNLPGNWEQYMNHPLTTWGKYSEVDNVLINRTGSDARFQNPDISQSYNGVIIPADSKYDHYQGKLTGQVNQDNIISLTYLYSKVTETGMGFQRSIPPKEAINTEFVGTGISKTEAWTLNWNSTLSAHWFLEAKASDSRLRAYDVQGPTTYPVFVFSFVGSGDPNRRLYAMDDPQNISGWDGRSTYFGPYSLLRSSSSYTPNIVGNRSYTVNFKTFQEGLGNHEIDFGGEFFQTQHQFGRERNRNYGVMEGGYIRDPSVSGMDASGYRFPVFYSADGSSLVPITDTVGNLPDSDMTLWSQNIYGPSAHIEQYNVGGSESHNNSQAFWINDTWTLNDRWNVMLGLRYNKFIVHDTNGKTQADNGIGEPRFQIKFNPDGKNKEVYSFSVAKLASRYSDDFASYFRTNGWTSRVVRAWSGAGYSSRNPGDAQPPVISGAPTGYDSGRYGVRWVTYEELINPDNYNTVPETVVALDQTMQTQGLQVPYAIEYSLGYTRNFETGSIKINLVNRTYKKDWVAYAHAGMYDPSDPYRYLTLVNNPVTGQPFSWNQTQPFINSDQDRDYQDVEISWVEKLTPRLTLGGNYTYSIEHGLSSELDYYNYRSEKLKLDMDSSVWGPTKALLSKGQMLNMYLMYEVPMGKGSASASILGKYYTNGRRSLIGYGNLNSANPNSTLPYKGTQLPVFALDNLSGQNTSEQYSIYYGGPNAFTAGSDSFDLAVKLQARLPLAGRVILMSEILISNPFNRINRNSIYDWGSDGVTDWTGVSTPVAGRALSQFSHPWGFADNSNYYDGGRSFSFNIGLKF